jgi:pimeloyl-ACP methyl ester carboxylesterase
MPHRVPPLFSLTMPWMPCYTHAHHEGGRNKSRVNSISTETVLLPSGLRITYRVAGGGPAVVLLHGWAASWWLWQDTMPALADAGYRAIAPDHIGCGDSDKPLAAYTPATYAAYLSDFVDALGLDRFDLVGHSLGGHIALSYALAHGGRLGRLIVVDPAYSPLRQACATRAELLLVASGLPILGELALALTPARLLRWIIGQPWGGFYRPERLEAAFLDQMVADYLMRASPLVANGIPYLVLFSLPGLSALRADADLRPRLAELAMPVMVAWGECDALLRPASFAALAAAIPGCTVLRISEAGHTPPIEAPQQFREALLQFLNP